MPRPQIAGVRCAERFVGWADACSGFGSGARQAVSVGRGSSDRAGGGIIEHTIGL